MSMPSATFRHQSTDNLSQQRQQSIAATIHRAVNLTELRAALDRLCLLDLPKEQAAALWAQAQALQSLLLTENNRAHVTRGR